MAIPAIINNASKLSPAKKLVGGALGTIKGAAFSKAGSAIFKAAGGNDVPLLKKGYDALSKSHEKSEEKKKDGLSAAPKKQTTSDGNDASGPGLYGNDFRTGPAPESHSEDLVKALTGLGYKHEDAHGASTKVSKETPLNDAIKQALKALTAPKKDQAKETSQKNKEADARAKESSITPTDNSSITLLQQVAVNTDDIKKILSKKGEEGKTGGILGALAGAISSSVGGLITTALGGAAMGGVAAKGAGMIGTLGKGALGGLKAAALGAGGLLGLGKGALVAGGGVVTAGKAAETVAAGGAKGLAAKAAGGAEEAAKVAGGAEKAAGTVAKDAAGGALKVAGKSILKKIPVIGLMAGIGFGVKRALAGDWLGAGMEVASGAAGMAPGLGTAASIGIDAALIARDLSNDGKEIGTPDAAANDTSFIDKFNAGQSSPSAVKGDVANVSSGSTVSGILSAMLARMMDEKQGIYVRQASNVLTDSTSLDKMSGKTPSTALVSAPTTPSTLSPATSVPGLASVPAPVVNKPFSQVQSTGSTSLDKMSGKTPSTLSPATSVPGLASVPAPVVNKPFSQVQSTGSNTPADFRPKPSSIAPINANANASLMSQTQDAINKGVGYKMGAKDLNSGKIDCSGWVKSINQNLIDDMSKQGEKLKGSAAAKKMFDGGAAEIVGNIAKVTGEVMTNKDLTADKLREGMIIGENNGAKNGRGKYGVDHITQVVKDPETGKIMISQSSGNGKGGGGVNLKDPGKYLDNANAKGKKLFAVDTNKALSTLTGGDYDAKANQLSAPVAAMATEMQKAKDDSRKNDKPATVVINQGGVGGGTKSVNSGSAGGAGLSAPMISRNPDSSIRRLTDATMSASIN